MIEEKENNSPVAGGVAGESSALAGAGVSIWGRDVLMDKIKSWFKWLSVVRNMDKAVTVIVGLFLVYYWLKIIFYHETSAQVIYNAINIIINRSFGDSNLATWVPFCIAFIGLIKMIIGVCAYLLKIPTVHWYQIRISDYIFGFLYNMKQRGAIGSGFYTVWAILFFLIIMLFFSKSLATLVLFYMLFLSTMFWLLAKFVNTVIGFIKSHKTMDLLIMLTFLFLLVEYYCIHVDLVIFHTGFIELFGLERINATNPNFLHELNKLLRIGNLSYMFFLCYFIRWLIVLRSEEG